MGDYFITIDGNQLNAALKALGVGPYLSTTKAKILV